MNGMRSIPGTWRASTSAAIGPCSASSARSNTVKARVDGAKPARGEPGGSLGLVERLELDARRAPSRPGHCGMEAAEQLVGGDEYEDAEALSDHAVDEVE